MLLLCRKDLAMKKRAHRHPDRNSKNRENMRGGCMWDFVRFLQFRRGPGSQKVVCNRRHGNNRIAICYKEPDDCPESDEISDCAAGGNGMQTSKSIRMLMNEEISKVEKLIMTSFAERKHMKNEPHETYCAKAGISPDVISNHPNNYKEIPELQNQQSQHEILVSGSSHKSNLPFLANKNIDCRYKEQKTQVNSENRKTLYVADKGESTMTNQSNVYSETGAAQCNCILHKTLEDVLDTFPQRKIVGSKRIHHDHEQKTLQSQELVRFLEMLKSDKILTQKFLQGFNSHHAHINYSEKPLAIEPCKLLEYIMLVGNEIESTEIKESEEPPSLEALRKGKTRSDSRKDEKGKPSVREKSHEISSISKAHNARSESSLAASSSSSMHQSSHRIRSCTRNEGTIFQFSLQAIKRKIKNFVVKESNGQNFTLTEPLLRNWHGFNARNRAKCMWRTIVEAHLATISSRNVKELKYAKRVERVTRENENSNATEVSFKKEAKRHIMGMLDPISDSGNLPENKVTATSEKLFLKHEHSSSSDNNASREKELDLSKRLFGSVNHQNALEESCFMRHQEVDLSGASSSSDDKGDEDLKDQLCMSNPTTDSSNPGLEAKNSESAASVKMFVDGIFYESLAADSVEICEDFFDQDSPKVKTESDYTGSYVPAMLDNHGTRPDIIVEKTDHPSPVSILEPPFFEDIFSPEYPKLVQTDCEKSPASRRTLHFEECIDPDETPPTIQDHQENEGSKLSYLRSLLEASGLLNHGLWEFRRRRRQILLDPSLFAEVEPPPSETTIDLWLFFDGICEVLEEMCSKFYTDKPWVGFLDPKPRPLPEGEDLVQKIWRKLGSFGVSEDLTVAEIVGGDLKAGSWVELAEGVDEIGVAIGDEILEEIFDEVVAIVMV